MYNRVNLDAILDLAKRSGQVMLGIYRACEVTLLGVTFNLFYVLLAIMVFWWLLRAWGGREEE